MAACTAAPAQAKVSIEVLSNRAEAVSGGDALVAVKFPKGTRASRVRVSLNGKRVTGRFAVRPTGRFEGLLTGLAQRREHRRRARARRRGRAPDDPQPPDRRPGHGGPQIQPWTCFAARRPRSATAR